MLPRTLSNPQSIFPRLLQLDSKNSPLALLAQTCSQIGSDSSNGVKALLSADKNKANGGKMENAKSPTAAQKLIMDSSRNTNSSSPGSTKSPPMNLMSAAPKNGLNKSASVDSNNNSNGSDHTVKLAFKPYENEVLAGKPKSGNNNRSVSDGRRSAEQQSVDQQKCQSPSAGGDGERRSNSNRSSADENRPSMHASPYASAQTSQSSPVLRQGVETMPTDYSAYKMAQMGNPYGLNPMAFPHGMDPQELLMNPAFRPPYATGYPSSVPPSSAAAASMLGYHPALSPYFGFGAAAAAAAVGGAMKGGPSGECKDPNCTGCTYSAAAQHHHQQMMLGLCPPGCIQCQHHKYNMAMAAIQSNYQMPSQQRPMVCNWINGDSYCGKKFNSGEELMHHLKTHTAGLSDPTAAAAALIQAQLQPNHAALGLPPPGSLYPPSNGAGLNRGYRTPPPLSPMSAAAAMRYHPYAAAAAAAAAVQGGKGGSPLPPMPPSSYSSFNPAMFSPYAYSPYAFYGQRSAVHP